ncbi:Leucine-rich repeat-containing protein [Ooceraea biroi]|uniref:Leucine-rich repeat-containing protein n=1 Tax=Ooceraea biroi TaxID=2015173 RepID=A0A026X2B9_OOCBI|nr:Leucine-rich repeat-containing protein [Ooceraea biroi]
MDPDPKETVKEVESKVILHWNYRDLAELPEAVRTHGGHVQEMYLKWNRLTVIPSWIMELRNLTNLYISGNLIRELPREISEMSQLTVLDLSDNELAWVPPCISDLSNLRTLLLNDNFIDKLPVELKRLSNLEVLSVSSNQIVVLPEWIGSLPRLKELHMDNNKLRELPNRLTLAPALTIISVCVNRLRYLPLNGFLSAPYIRFDINDFLNYMSYPLLFQLLSRLRTTLIDDRGTLAYGCFKSHDDVLNTNIKLYIEMKGFYKKNADVIIELPRQLLKVHGVHENATCSLLELALRKVYTGRFKHTLDVTISPPNATVLYAPLSEAKFDFTMTPTNYMFRLLRNGPASICVNPRCQQPIFTEAWTIIGISFHAEMITTALCCSKSCATAFATHSSTTITTLDWHCINR